MNYNSIIIDFIFYIYSFLISLPNEITYNISLSIKLNKNKTKSDYNYVDKQIIRLS